MTNCSVSIQKNDVNKNQADQHQLLSKPVLVKLLLLLKIFLKTVVNFNFAIHKHSSTQHSQYIYPLYIHLFTIF